MDKCFIKEELINSYETIFDNHSITINEYSPSLTDDELQSRKESIKTILAKAFFHDEKS